jgi:hypothetical protein
MAVLVESETNKIFPDYQRGTLRGRVVILRPAQKSVKYSEGYSWLLRKVVSINCDSHVILVVSLSKVLKNPPDL